MHGSRRGASAQPVAAISAIRDGVFCMLWVGCYISVEGVKVAESQGTRSDPKGPKRFQGIQLQCPHSKVPRTMTPQKPNDSPPQGVSS